MECFRDGQWHPAPALKVARSQARATVVDGAIYVMGGFDDIDDFSSVE